MGSSSDRYKHLRATLGEGLLEKVQNAKLLVVGAGGIGCELLKNLVLTGFRNIEVVDLDTIDVSNLNRQFLFRRNHVSQSKSAVASVAVMAFNPDARVLAHHGNVKSPEFGLSYIENFDIVLNALDNVDARRHVNRLCLARGKPLIESGTTGYLGQVTVIKKGETECYDCQPKAVQKTYPICTIRSTPEKPVHCIVWAKELYKLVFGAESESMLYEDPNGPEPSVYMEGVLGRPPLEGATDEQAMAYAHTLLKGQFIDEVQKRVDTGIYKGARQAPKKPVDDADRLFALVREHSMAESRGGGSAWQKRIWDVDNCVREFARCVCDIMCNPQKRALVGTLEFDKDDCTAMQFVAAASNLRCYVFGIPPSSYYDTKGIAGSIIPAIATTNAIIAGLQVMQALKIVEGLQAIPETCKYIYCNREPTRKGLLLLPTKLEKPSPSCFVCSKRQLDLYVDTTRMTLEEFLSKVLKLRLGINEPSIVLGNSTLYEEGEDAEEQLQDNLPKKLKDLPAGGVVDSSCLDVEDFSQDLEIIINVHQECVSEKDYADGYRIDGLDEPLRAAAPKGVESTSAPRPTSDGVTDGGDDGGVVTFVDPNRVARRASKRKHDGSTLGASEEERARARKRIDEAIQVD